VLLRRDQVPFLGSTICSSLYTHKNQANTSAPYKKPIFSRNHPQRCTAVRPHPNPLRLPRHVTSKSLTAPCQSDSNRTRNSTRPESLPDISHCHSERSEESPHEQQTVAQPKQSGHQLRLNRCQYVSSKSPASPCRPNKTRTFTRLVRNCECF